MIFYGIRSALLADDPLGDVVDLFARREDAEQFIAECLADEPEWADALSIEAVEFELSAN